MTLNRNSFFIDKNGTSMRVKDMRLLDLGRAVLYLEDLQWDLMGDDIYIVKAVNEVTPFNPFDPPPPVITHINGVTLEDWEAFLRDEIEQRERRLRIAIFHPKSKVKKVHWLVKMFKFW